MMFDPSVEPAILKGIVHASKKNKSYKVEISVDIGDGSIVEAKCDCPRGQVICHHVAALCLFGHNNISVTDTACTWNQPSEKETTITKLKDIFPMKPGYCAVKEHVTDEQIRKFKSDLGQSNVVGFSWLLKEVPSQETDIVPSIESLIYSQEYLSTLDKQ